MKTTCTFEFINMKRNLSKIHFNSVTYYSLFIKKKKTLVIDNVLSFNLQKRSH